MIDKIKFIEDKEYFKEIMLETIEKLDSNYGLCFIIYCLIDEYIEFDKKLIPFLKAPDNIGNGFNSDGSIREGGKEAKRGFWWSLNKKDATRKEWYKPRIEYIKNL